MYTLISKWTILPGHEQEAIKALKKLPSLVKKAEPDTLMYTVHTPDFTQANLPTPAAGEVIFFEIYKNKKAFDNHVNGQVFKTFVTTYGHLFLYNLGAPFVTLELLTHQGGFIREGIM